MQNLSKIFLSNDVKITPKQRDFESNLTPKICWHLKYLCKNLQTLFLAICVHASVKQMIPKYPQYKAKYRSVKKFPLF